MPNDCVDSAVSNGRGMSEIFILFWLAVAAAMTGDVTSSATAFTALSLFHGVLYGSA